MYALLYQQIEQFRKGRGTMAIRGMAALRRSYEKVMRKFMTELPLKERLAGIPPEKLLELVPPKKRLAGLPAETLLKHLPPERRLEGLTPRQIAKAINALPPEAREELLKKLAH